MKKQSTNRDEGYKGKKPARHFSASKGHGKKEGGSMHQKVASSVEGIFTVQRSGAAFVVPAHKVRSGDKSQDRANDIRIMAGTENGAWHGDLVRAERVNPNSRDGLVAEVLKRANEELAVVVREKGPGSLCTCVPVDMRYPFSVQVETKGLPRSVEEGELLIVAPQFEDAAQTANQDDQPPVAGRANRAERAGRTTRRNRAQHYVAQAIRSMGQEDTAPVQEAFAKFNNGIPTVFPQEVLEEVKALDLAGRQEAASVHRPLLDFPFVTIDGPDSRDFDDAIFVRREDTEGKVDPKGTRFRLMVAIADVSAWVLPHSALDKEAYRRGNSYYFPSSVEPMLPPLLSDDICSLLPLVPRSVMYADMLFDAKGHEVPNAARFGCGTIISAARLTYEAVQAFYDAPATDKPTFAADVPAMLKEAKALAELLIARRKQEGGLDFTMPEPVFSVNQAGKVTSVVDHPSLFSHKLIEAFMVAANEAVAVFLEKKKVPFLYRAHPDPSQEKVWDLKQALGEIGLELPSLKKSKPSEKSEKEGEALSPKGLSAFYSALLDSMHGTAQEFVVDRLALRSLMQARYSPIKEGHFGLASASYCHFTSPIRRYADLVNHRVLKKALGLPGGHVETEKKLLDMADTVNGTERLATLTEREVARRLACLYFMGKEGEEWPAVISSVTSFGFFAELVGLPVEVLVRMENLGADYFAFMPERHELVGELSGQVYRLGQSIQLAIRQVNLRQLDIEAVPTGAGGEDMLFGKKRGANFHKRVANTQRRGDETAGMQAPKRKPYYEKPEGQGKKEKPVRRRSKQGLS